MIQPTAANAAQLKHTITVAVFTAAAAKAVAAADND